jgi:PST family polysaccharide transporter
MVAATGGIALKVRSGMAWSLIESWSVQALQFLGFLIVARYVDATALGVVAMALLAGQFFQMTILSGISTPMVGAGRDDPDMDHTAFWIAFAMGGLMLAATLVCAGPAERMLQQPGLASVLRWLSLANFLMALNVVPQAWLTRALMMRPLAVRSTMSTLAGALVGIPMAMAGYGLNALVAQNLVTALVGAAILWAACPRWPRLCFATDKAREIVFYGRHVTLSGIANFFNANSDVLIVGTVLGAAAAGLYTVGKRALLAANLLLSRALSRVAFPAFSQLKHDRVRLAAAYLKLVSATSLITTPAFVGLALVADPFIHLFFGDRWAGAIPVMQYLSLFGALQAVGIYNQSLMLALGKPHWQTWLAAIYAVANCTLFFAAADQGPGAIAAAFTGRAWLLYPLSIWTAILLLPIGWRDYWRAIRLSLFGSLVMTGVVLGLHPFLVDMAPLASMIAIATTGALAYACALLLVGRSAMAEMLAFARGRQPAV